MPESHTAYQIAKEHRDGAKYEVTIRVTEGTETEGVYTPLTLVETRILSLDGRAPAPDIITALNTDLATDGTRTPITSQTNP